ncbi:hypothetical protein [Pedobacter nutrimenti]|jgi:hypothetical protein|uniref:HTH cro/C1-type domain-containing protein n=1 Tax=Pedobacter nutrimenti TaxID=1241337 RepID=A0A318UP11_9SPHI|nr:hypothetical protein [Pedobacter nutrimenti]PYF75825.1 hypothetical protein B0O44_102379 [Pedobacter nutrimenti]
MTLKTTVDEILKKKNRSLSWLAVEMDKTFDGLKLSLVKGSIKYNDIVSMSAILNVSPNVFFEQDKAAVKEGTGPGESETEYASLKNDLRNCRELSAALKDQLKDKEKIIGLLTKD